jgi:hypothetical protein
MECSLKCSEVPSAIIDQDLAHKVYNIIGDKDKGSQLCNGGLSGIGRRKDKAEIEVIDQTETQKWIQGHYFMQPDYQKKISEYLQGDCTINCLKRKTGSASREDQA